jgi:hypothetical protein
MPDESEDSEGLAARIAPEAASVSAATSMAAALGDETSESQADRLSKVNPLYGRPTMME